MKQEDEILYGKREAPALMKLFDELSQKVNDKIRARGISKGFVCVQEDFNSLSLEAEKRIFWATQEHDIDKRLALIISIQNIVKNVWVDIRFMYKNKSLTRGEIGELSKTTSHIETQLNNWNNAMNDKAMSGQG